MSDEFKLKLFPWDDEGTKPFFTNSEGIEWWVEKETTQWANRENEHGISLKNIVGFILRKDGNPLTRVLMDKETDEVIYENTGLEAIACYISMLKTVKLYNK